MCRYESERTHHPFPEAGDPVCNKPNVGALTASVMAGLATLDGIACELKCCTSLMRPVQLTV